MAIGDMFPVIMANEKDIANGGVPTLDINGKIKKSQLPDDLDVNGSITNHNSDSNAHGDIRTLVQNAIDNAVSAKEIADEVKESIIDINNNFNSNNTYVDEKISEFKLDLSEHISDINNPHRVTASQIGATTKEEVQTKIDQVLATAKEYVNEKIDSITPGSMGVVTHNEVKEATDKALADAKAYTDTQINTQVSNKLNTHTDNKTNPHGVTAAQVGADVAGSAAQALTDAKAYTNTHANRTDNPHKVTAEQVGARPNTWTPTASDVGARPNTWMPTAANVGADPAGSAAQALVDAKKYADTKTSNVTPDSIGAITKTEAQSKVDAAISTAKTYTDTHANNKNNPHGVTAAQVGALTQNDIDSALSNTSTKPIQNKVVYQVNQTATQAKATADAALAKSGGNMTGALIAQSNSDYTTPQVRNISSIPDSETLPSLSNNNICLVYEIA